MKNMNAVQFLEAIANGEMNNDIMEWAKNRLATRDEEAKKAAQKRNDKWYAENGALLEAVRNLLGSVTHAVTAAEIVASIDGIDSTSKATAVVKRIEGVRVVDVQVDKRIVKGYTL